LAAHRTRVLTVEGFLDAADPSVIGCVIDDHTRPSDGL
jgi:hypothetical protein